MIIKLVYFLYIYYAFITVWAVSFLVGIYHLLKFGFKNFATFIMTFIFIGVAVLLLWGSNNYINQTDWNSEITILQSNFSSMPFNK